MPLTKETQDRIERDAHYHTKYGQPKCKTLTECKYSSYIAGATTENENMQPVIDAAEKVAKIFAHTGDHQTCAICELARALQQWNEGKGKAEQIPAFDYESREWEEEMSQPASKEAINKMKERWIAEGKRECPDCGLWFKSEGRCPDCNPMG